jgi:hypothetical protein
MNPFPLFISILMIACTAITVWLFVKAASNSKKVLITLLVWLAFQAALGLAGFYTSSDGIPPRFMLMISPAMLFILLLFITKKGRRFIDSLDIKALTLLHAVRLPVEIVLLLLFINKGVPELMTFEGRNFDILSGISAPVIYYFGFVRKKIGTNALIIWNFLCLALVINIAVNGILSVPSAFQQFGFEQPNTALMYFPFVWLPSCIVTLVLLSHFVALRQLFRQKASARVALAAETN